MRSCRLREKWQRELLQSIYNDVDEEGFRRIRTFYTSVPRKNGKTELAAAIALFHLLSEGEKGADVVCAAKSRDQAKLVFNAAKTMVRLDWPHHRRLSSPNRTRLRENAGNPTYPRTI